MSYGANTALLFRLGSHNRCMTTYASWNAVERIYTLITNLLIELNVIRTQLTQDIPGFFCHGLEKQIHSSQTTISNGIALSRAKKRKPFVSVSYTFPSSLWLIKKKNYRSCNFTLIVIEVIVFLSGGGEGGWSKSFYLIKQYN